MYDVVTGAIEFLPGAGAEAARPTAVVSSRDTLSSARAEAVAAPGPAGPRL
jgi:hypothetical protein